MKNAIKNAVAEAAKAYGAEGYEVKMGSSTSAAVEALKDDISSVTYDKTNLLSFSLITIECKAMRRLGERHDIAAQPHITSL